MKTIGVTLIVVLAGLAAAVAVARPASSAGTALTGSVGPGYSISLLQNGTKVSSLAPGDYTITIDDKSADHNFHLLGPGVDQATAVETTGTTTWNVTFQNGTYTYQCDVHGALMTGKFTVGDVATTTTTPTTTSSAPPALRVRATAKSAAGHIAAVRLAANRSASFDVSLYRGKARVAHAAAKGKVATVRLKARKAGRYVAKIVARAGGSTAKTSVAVSVK
jgi:plastocyanin